MSWLVDTSVWSLALRLDVSSPKPEVQALRNALQGASIVEPDRKAVMAEDGACKP